jgi:hypothetical protein
MFSRRKARLIVFVAAAVTLGSGLLIYVTPASTNVNPAPVADRSDFSTNATLTPWSDDLSENAVDAGGIEKDLDGNASALFASDCGGRPSCGNLRQPVIEL